MKTKDIFGNLRTILIDLQENPQGDTQELLLILREARYRLGDKEYQEAVQPYLESYTFPDPLWGARSWRELEAMVFLVPPARFSFRPWGYDFPEVFSSPLMERVTSLNLMNTRLGDEGLRALANSPHLSNLTFLNLGVNGIGSEGARAIADSPYLSNLISLHLWENEIGDEGVRALSESPYLKNLTCLNLWNTRIGDEGLRAIADSPYLKSLTCLALSNNDIGEKGVRLLAKSPNFKNLTPLNLEATWV